MTYTILFIVALICVSGFIAYSGDVLGRKMGKKRLTLFNLRPRYTAIVVTTITGMLISTFALVTLVSVNSQFRKVLLNFEQILQQNKQLTQSNYRLIMRGKELKIQVAKKKRELADALDDAKLAKKQRDKAVSVVARLRLEIAARQSELTELRKRQNVAESELRQRESELRLTLTKLEAAEKRVAVAQSNLSDVQKKLDVAKANLERTQGLLEDAKNAFAEQTNAADVAADFALKLRMSELAFRQGDELTRGIIDPQQSDFELRRDLYALLEKASKKALDAGAKNGDNGRAVSVMYWQVASKTRALVIHDEYQCVDMAVKKIATSNDAVMVQVVCGMNTLPDAQVPVELRLYVDDLIYKKGDKVAEAKIDGRQSEGHILLALSDFLQVDVAKAAMRAGVVPVTGQDPRVAMGKNRQAQTDELLGIVSKIKSMDTSAIVTVYASDDVLTSDSLNMDNVRFSVAKAD